MKVGTDGVLLGAWTRTVKTGRILDVGAGSGLIALMCAQRNPGATVDSVELDANASEQANENFSNSPFENITQCLNTSFQDFAQNTVFKYNSIVCNPPFFSNSLHAPDEKRSFARHDDSLTMGDFISLSQNILCEDGFISFIYPAEQRDCISLLAEKNGLYITRFTEVFPTPYSDPKRVLFELSLKNNKTQLSKLIIEEERHKYSNDFINLVKDFYLKM